MCDYLPSTVDVPENYYVDNPLRTVGQIVTVYCQNVTVAVVKCMTDLKWNGTVPSCSTKDVGENLGTLLIIVWVVGGVLLFALLVLITIIVSSRSKTPCGSRGASTPSTSVFHISGISHRSGGRGGDNPGFSRADERCGEWSFHRARPITDSDRLPSYHEAILSNYITATANSGNDSLQTPPVFVSSPPSYRTSQLQTSTTQNGSSGTDALSCEITRAGINTDVIQADDNQDTDINQRNESHDTNIVGNQNTDHSHIKLSQETSSQEIRNNISDVNQENESSDISQTNENLGNRINKTRRIYRSVTNQRTENLSTESNQGIDNDSIGASHRIENHNIETSQIIQNQCNNTEHINENLCTNIEHTNENQCAGINQRSTRLLKCAVDESRASSNSSTTSKDAKSCLPSTTLMSRRYAENYPQCFFQDEPPPPYSHGLSDCYTPRSPTRQYQRDMRGHYQNRRSMHVIPSVYAHSRQNESEILHNQNFRRSMYERPTTAADSNAISHRYNSPPHQNYNVTSSQNYTGHDSRRKREISYPSNSNIRLSNPRTPSSSPNLRSPNLNHPSYNTNRHLPYLNNPSSSSTYSNLHSPNLGNPSSNSNLHSSSSNTISSTSNYPFTIINNVPHMSSALNHIAIQPNSYGARLPRSPNPSIHEVPNYIPNALQTFPLDSRVPTSNYSLATRQSYVSSTGIVENITKNTTDQSAVPPQENQKMYVIKGFQATPPAPYYFLNTQSHGLSRRHHFETQPLCTSTPISQSPATDRKFVPTSFPSPLPIAHKYHMKVSNPNHEQIIFQRLKDALEVGHTSNASQEQTSMPQYLPESHQTFHYSYSRQGSAPIARLDSEFL